MNFLPLHCYMSSPSPPLFDCLNNIYKIKVNDKGDNLDTYDGNAIPVQACYRLRGFQEFEVSVTFTGHLYRPSQYYWYSFLSEVESTTIIPSGIEPVTLPLVRHCTTECPQVTCKAKETASFVLVGRTQ
jgi:hypothetical protein